MYNANDPNIPMFSLPEGQTLGFKNNANRGGIGAYQNMLSGMSGWGAPTATPQVPRASVPSPVRKATGSANASMQTYQNIPSVAQVPFANQNANYVPSSGYPDAYSSMVNYQTNAVPDAQSFDQMIGLDMGSLKDSPAMAGDFSKMFNGSMGNDGSILDTLKSWSNNIKDFIPSGFLGSTDANGIKTDGWGLPVAQGLGALWGAKNSMDAGKLARDSFNFQRDNALENMRITKMDYNDRKQSQREDARSGDQSADTEAYMRTRRA